MASEVRSKLWRGGIGGARRGRFRDRLNYDIIRAVVVNRFFGLSPRQDILTEHEVSTLNYVEHRSLQTVFYITRTHAR